MKKNQKHFGKIRKNQNKYSSKGHINLDSSVGGIYIIFATASTF